MNVLLVMPGEAPRRIDIDGTLASMQEVVGGYIQAIYPFDEPVAVVCNEDAKLIGMELNRALRSPDTNEIYDIIAGPFFICGLGNDNFASITDHDAEVFSKMFHCPEVFLTVGDKIVVLSI